MEPVKIVDLFAGPGGLDVAAEKLGIKTVGVEWDADACRTRRAAGLATVEGDVRKFGPSYRYFSDADVLAAGPPCQTFTVAGGGAGRRALDLVLKFVKSMVAREDITRDLSKVEDERTRLVLEPLRWALQAIDDRRGPYKAIILEQVPAVLPVWEAYAEALRSEKYSVDYGILRTEQYGVPQTRRRAVLIARLGRDEEVALPRATHRAYRKGVSRAAGEMDLLPWRAMRDVLHGRSRFSVISNYGTGGDPEARGRRSSEEPAATVTGKIFRNRVISDKGIELERFSASEAGLLQTFPIDYPWSGRDIGQQIGNAIPPRLAMHIIRAALGGEPPAEDDLQRLNTWRPEEIPDSVVTEDSAVEDSNTGSAVFGSSHAAYRG